ncbi:MAG: EscU/YscU/HrcU family type III secretion system export apparatus switch protein [Pseudomonadota bacterium]
MSDAHDDGFKKSDENQLKPLNIKEKSDRQTAVALKGGENDEKMPLITAAGRGKLAEQILQIAYENDIKVRTDADLAEILAKIELDSPIPGDAFLAVAEILSYVYHANGEPDPFDAVLKSDMDEE